MSVTRSVVPPATLKEVANAAGVSVSTASKIFLGKTDNFKSSTIRKVKRAAEQLNYVPNALARGVVTGSLSNVIGYFVSNILNPFFSEFVTYLEKYLCQKGYLLSLCVFEDNPVLMRQYIKFLTEIRASGAIFGCCHLPDCTDDIRFARATIPMVSIQSDFDNIDRIDTEDEAGTYQIVKHLIEKGHRKIAFLGYQFDLSVMSNRIAGYKRALVEAGIPISNNYIKAGEHSGVSGQIQTIKLLELDDPPTAIHCANEYMAQAAFQAIYEKGLRIPNDISVTGFDNTRTAKILAPPLTTVSQPLDAMAYTAVNLLMEQINTLNAPYIAKHITLPCSIVERSSVADISSK